MHLSVFLLPGMCPTLSVDPIKIVRPPTLNFTFSGPQRWIGDRVSLNFDNKMQIVIIRPKGNETTSSYDFSNAPYRTAIYL